MDRDTNSLDSGENPIQMVAELERRKDEQSAERES